jgi:hypothetical protein
MPLRRVCSTDEAQGCLSTETIFYPGIQGPLGCLEAEGQRDWSNPVFERLTVKADYLPPAQILSVRCAFGSQPTPVLPFKVCSTGY